MIHPAGAGSSRYLDHSGTVAIQIEDRADYDGVNVCGKKKPNRVLQLFATVTTLTLVTPMSSFSRRMASSHAAVSVLHRKPSTSDSGVQRMRAGYWTGGHKKRAPHPQA